MVLGRVWRGRAVAVWPRLSGRGLGHGRHGGDAGVHHLDGLRREFGDVPIGGQCRQLVLPEIEITTRQGVDFRWFRHGSCFTCEGAHYTPHGVGAEHFIAMQHLWRKVRSQRMASTVTYEGVAPCRKSRDRKRSRSPSRSTPIGASTIRRRAAMSPSTTWRGWSRKVSNLSSTTPRPATTSPAPCSPKSLSRRRPRARTFYPSASSGTSSAFTATVCRPWCRATWTTPCKPSPATRNPCASTSRKPWAACFPSGASRRWASKIWPSWRAP